MIWAIQDSITWSALENNVKPIMNALKLLDKPMVNVGYAADIENITGTSHLSEELPTIFYGSTKLAERASQSNFKPGAFYNNDWWNPNYWASNRNDLLNQTIINTTIGELRKNWITEPIFIKPQYAKYFAGQVIEVEERIGWLAEYSLILTDNIEICCSPLHKIEQEWRFFIVGGKVITGSSYKKWGCVITKEAVSDQIFKIAQTLADKWLPHETIVMDICELRDGEFKVVEFNSVNSSGFYNCDIPLIIEAIEDKYNG
jgi:hypothetical protein